MGVNPSKPLSLPSPHAQFCKMKLSGQWVWSHIHPLSPWAGKWLLNPTLVNAPEQTPNSPPCAREGREHSDWLGSGRVRRRWARRP